MNSTFDQKKVKKFLTRLFQKTGITPQIYRPVINGLIETSLRGVDSHGVRLVPHYLWGALKGRINKNPRISWKKTSKTTAIIDADNAYGITAGNIAMEIAIEMAQKEGVGIGVVKNSSHFGAAALYSLKAARKNLIGLSFTNVDSLAVPFGGKKPYLGTNPLCFAAPCEGEEPFCLDMATTTISWNRLMMYRKKNEKLPPGLAVNKSGEVTTNPLEAIALIPIGHYKGYGLGLMVEILCSLLTGMPFGSHISPMFPVSGKKRYLSHFFMAIDIKRFQPIKVFKKRMKQLLTELRDIDSVKGMKKVMVAGDPEKIIYLERVQKGIPVDSVTLEEINKMAEYLKIKERLDT